MPLRVALMVNKSRPHVRALVLPPRAAGASAWLAPSRSAPQPKPRRDSSPRRDVSGRGVAHRGVFARRRSLRTRATAPTSTDGSAAAVRQHRHAGGRTRLAAGAKDRRARRDARARLRSRHGPARSLPLPTTRARCPQRRARSPPACDAAATIAHQGREERPPSGRRRERRCGTRPTPARGRGSNSRCGLAGTIEELLDAFEGGARRAAAHGRLHVLQKGVFVKVTTAAGAADFTGLGGPGGLAQAPGGSTSSGSLASALVVALSLRVADGLHPEPGRCARITSRRWVPSLHLAADAVSRYVWYEVEALDERLEAEAHRCCASAFAVQRLEAPVDVIRSTDGIAFSVPVKNWSYFTRRRSGRLSSSSELAEGSPRSWQPLIPTGERQIVRSGAEPPSR